MNKGLLQLGLGCALAFGALSCNRAAYVKLPASTAYSTSAASQPAVKAPPPNLPPATSPLRSNRSAHLASEVPAAPSSGPSPRLTSAISFPARLAHGPVAARKKTSNGLQKARFTIHRRSAASVQEADPYKGILKVILIGLGLLLLGLVGVFALSSTWLQVLAGVVAVIGLLLSFGLYLALS